MNAQGRVVHSWVGDKMNKDTIHIANVYILKTTFSVHGLFPPLATKSTLTFVV